MSVTASIPFRVDAAVVAGAATMLACCPHVDVGGVGLPGDCLAGSLGHDHKEAT